MGAALTAALRMAVGDPTAADPMAAMVEAEAAQRPTEVQARLVASRSAAPAQLSARVAQLLMPSSPLSSYLFAESISLPWYAPAQFSERQHPLQQGTVAEMATSGPATRQSCTIIDDLQRSGACCGIARHQSRKYICAATRIGAETPPFLNETP